MYFAQPSFSIFEWCGLGQKSLKEFVGFLVEMMTPKRPFEIN
jgi:hypothetical protein